MQPLVTEQVSKKYTQGGRSVSALCEVDLSVATGELVAIMGASGSGKSTLLHLLAGLTRADSGRVLVNGKDMAAMNDSALTLFRRHHVGLIFQAFNLIPTLSAEENIALPLLLDARPAGEIRQRVDKLLEMLHLQQRRSHRPDAMSGGEQQRVAIGRALITDPTVILADEPTGNLDSANSRSVCALLRELSETHRRTIVLVTHEADVAAYAHRVIHLKDGRVVP